MNPRFSLIVAALALVPSAQSAPISVDLGGARVWKTRYTVLKGPAAEPPSRPPNLTERQLDELSAFLVPDVRNLQPGFPPPILFRLRNVLESVDMNFKRAIPAAEWDGLLERARQSFLRRHGPPARARMSPEDWERAIDGMLTELVAGLADPYTAYQDHESNRSFREHLSARFVGVGAALEKIDDGTSVTFVYPESPADQAGIVVGDVITAIDGVETRDEDLNTVAGRLRGAAGTEVQVRIARLERSVPLIRAQVKMRDLFGKMAGGDIGYVYLSGFTEKIDQRLFVKIDELKGLGAAKLIIDLRGNGGGLLDEAQSIASEFLQDKDVIVMTKRQGGLAKTAVTEGRGRYVDMPVAVLMDGGSASASELLAAALQEHGRAAVVGSISYGKGSFQSVIDTDIPVVVKSKVIGARADGTSTKITSGGWFTPNDRSVEGTYDPAAGRNVPGSGGVRPDEAVSVSVDERQRIGMGIVRQLYETGSAEPNDAAYDKAVEVLSR